MEDNIFFDCEKLYRAVFPQSRVQMFWKKDGTISSAALRIRMVCLLNVEILEKI